MTATTTRGQTTPTVQYTTAADSGTTSALTAE